MVELSRGRNARGKARNDRRTCECATARAELLFAAAHAPPQLDGDDRRADQPNKGAVRGCLCVESWTGADGFLSLYDLYHSIFYIDYLSLKMTSIKKFERSHRKLQFSTSAVLFAWLIRHQPAVLFSQNKSATSNQPAVLFSQNKPASAISHQPTE
jgi:hypothetical protein